MAVSRRDFLKISGATVGLSSLSFNPSPARAEVPGLRDSRYTFDVVSNINGTPENKLEEISH